MSAADNKLPNAEQLLNDLAQKIEPLLQANTAPVSYTHLTLPTTPYV